MIITAATTLLLAELSHIPSSLQYLQLPPRRPHHYFDGHMPILKGFCPLQRIGGDGDGGKLLCGMDKIAKR